MANNTTDNQQIKTATLNTVENDHFRKENSTPETPATSVTPVTPATPPSTIGLPQERSIVLLLFISCFYYCLGICFLVFPKEDSPIWNIELFHIIFFSVFILATAFSLYTKRLMRCAFNCQVVVLLSESMFLLMTIMYIIEKGSTLRILLFLYVLGAFTIVTLLTRLYLTYMKKYSKYQARYTKVPIINV